MLEPLPVYERYAGRVFINVVGNVALVCQYVRVGVALTWNTAVNAERLMADASAEVGPVGMARMHGDHYACSPPLAKRARFAYTARELAGHERFHAEVREARARAAEQQAGGSET